MQVTGDSSPAHKALAGSSLAQVPRAMRGCRSISKSWAVTGTLGFGSLTQSRCLGTEASWSLTSTSLSHMHGANVMAMNIWLKLI